MNIAIDARSLARVKTGVHAYLRNILMQLQKIDKANNYYLFAKVDFDFQIENPKWKKIICKGLLGNIMPVWLQFTVPQLLKKYKIDLFWGQFLMPVFAGKSIRKLVTIHDLTYIYSPKSMTLQNRISSKIVVSYSIKKSDQLLVVSKATKDAIAENFPKIPLGKIHVVYPASALSRNNHASSEVAVLDKHSVREPYVLSVCSFEPRKNLPALLRAFKIVKKENYTLVLAGSTGWKQRKLFNEIRCDPFLCAHVKILKNIPDEELDIIYRKANLFVYPSFYEGFGIPVLEAMERGVPIITSDSSSLPEVGGNAVIYFNPNDIEGLVQNIKKILGDNELVETCRQLGFMQAKKFSWEKSAQDVLQIINSML